MKILYRLILISSIIVLFLAAREWSLAPDGKTRISFLDVGQGDSTIIRSPEGKIIVLDGGPDWSTLEGLGKRHSFFRRKIDALVFTHANLDHYASFPELLQRYTVGKLFISNVALQAPWALRIVEAAQRQGTQIVPLHAGMTVNIGDSLRMEVLWPPMKLPKTFATDSNNTSLVLRVRDASHAALFTGDIESIVEETLVASRTNLRSEVLKVPHHGSKTSSTIAFIRSVQPSLAIVSVGSRNTYGHPNASVIERYKAIGATVRRTDQEGDIEVVW